jgi:hypothetical protein
MTTLPCPPSFRQRTLTGLASLLITGGLLAANLGLAGHYASGAPDLGALEARTGCPDRTVHAEPGKSDHGQQRG